MEKDGTLLITGGAGFIGSHLVERLLSRGHKVACLDNFDGQTYPAAIKRKNLEPFLQHPNLTLIQGDLLEQAFLRETFSQHSFETVVHLAGVAGVRLSLEQPQLYEEVNIRGTLNLLEECRKAPPARFVFASSSSVYGNSPHLPLREDQALFPVSPYGASKAAAEAFCLAYHRLYRFPVVILRFFTVYGPRQRPDMAIYKFTRAIEKGEPLRLFGHGESQRDYTYIDDIVDGIEGSLSYQDRGCSVFNLGSGRPVALKTLVRHLEEALGREARIEEVSPQPGDVDATHADISRAQDSLGYVPQITVQQGVSLFVQWYRSNGLARA